MSGGQRRTAGVLGGLGPLATIEFMSMVAAATVAKVEQEHADLIVTQRSSTPDRTAAILRHGPSPAPVMAADAKRLETAGAEFIVIPCNTASKFLGAVEEAVSIPVVSIVEETLSEVQRRLPQASSIGLMATDGTLAARVYHDAAERAGFEVIVPDERTQARVMAMIYDGVKAGRDVPRQEFFECVEVLRQAGADAVITGCTELSVLCSHFGANGGQIVDSLASLARRTVIECGCELA
ncbi:Aspartate racemase [Actinomyces bovis]|uniref:Aspartate racemase n=1 Tax=Actinomyces bovis TaxID=1658 RepID=A0ABY1VPP7_9ACTO|nr:amino acid racemase [Actinomyces bovis]SPT54101.1 Aspartate racemase [Actinomyces bovis]VEG53673.1 Aspartate racemase [Actinomyces israelii]